MVNHWQFALLLSFSFYHTTNASEQEKVLVLLDDFDMKETHSVLFDALEDRFAITFKLSNASNMYLSKYDALCYDHLMILCPDVQEFGGNISKEAIVDFVDKGGNLFVATGHTPSPIIRELATECGIEVDAAGNQVIDHFYYDFSDDGYHTLLAIDSKNLLKAPLVVGKPNAPILYSGSGLYVNKESPLVIPLLKAYDTSYSANVSEVLMTTPLLVGTDTVLIAATQALNNARMLFSGSIYMFSNEALLSGVKSSTLESAKSGNQELMNSLVKWVFKENGVIRVKSVSHHLLNETTPPVDYTIMETVVFNMELEEKRDGIWSPFNTNDLQLEFVRIDPFIRTFVPCTGNGTYSVNFMIPDTYGVFKFVVDYRRLGYTFITSTTQVSVRPLKHDQHERFIRSAYPYYLSAFSMMFGVVVFSFVFWHSEEPKEEKKKKRE